MIRIERLGPSMTVLCFGDGDAVLFSYETPVAAKVEGRYIQTEKFVSRSSADHVRKWLEGIPVSLINTVPHAELLEVLEDD